MVQCCPFDLRSPYLRACQFPALFDIPDHGVFHLLSVIGQQMAICQFKSPCPPHLEDFVRVSEIGFALFDYASNIGERMTLCFQHLSHAMVHRQATQVLAPGDSYSFEVAFQGRGELAACPNYGDRRSWITAGNSAEHEGSIRHRSRHRPLHRQREPASGSGPYGDSPRRSPEPHHVTEVRRVSQRPPEVASVGDRLHTARQCHCGPSTASTTRLGRIVGIECFPKDLVVCLRAGPELGRIRFSDSDGPGFLQPFND